MPSVNSAGRLAGCFVTPLVACCGEQQRGTGHQTPLLVVFFPCPATALCKCRLKTRTWVQGCCTERGTAVHLSLPVAASGTAHGTPLGMADCRSSPGCRGCRRARAPCSAGTCRAGTGPGACGSTNATAPLSNAGALAPAGMGQRCCTHTPVSSPRGAALWGAALLLLRQELQLFLWRRERTVSTCCICSG